VASSDRSTRQTCTVALPGGVGLPAATSGAKVTGEPGGGGAGAPPGGDFRGGVAGGEVVEVGESYATG